jgi:hypothetical protein
VLPEAFAASISRLSRAEIDAMPNSSRFGKHLLIKYGISPTMGSSSVPKQIAGKSIIDGERRGCRLGTDRMQQALLNKEFPCQ